jgi:hypothetical protein
MLDSLQMGFGTMQAGEANALSGRPFDSRLLEAVRKIKL